MGMILRSYGLNKEQSRHRGALATVPGQRAAAGAAKWQAPAALKDRGNLARTEKEKEATMQCRV